VIKYNARRKRTHFLQYRILQSGNIDVCVTSKNINIQYISMRTQSGTFGIPLNTLVSSHTN